MSKFYTEEHKIENKIPWRKTIKIQEGGNLSKKSKFEPKFRGVNHIKIKCFKRRTSKFYTEEHKIENKIPWRKTIKIQEGRNLSKKSKFEPKFRGVNHIKIKCFKRRRSKFYTEEHKIENKIPWRKTIKIQDGRNLSKKSKFEPKFREPHQN
ncbi:uncharacterized protein LOC113471134 [Diaphorina citri]|uniref:Uncharacterized protein LOC113471134 n=1 Tax=Diaphorina citri TaxID=121845 RepID=A0A3Q0JGN8_DIACI|nr:uncharacterized protein LOC113471134 [Diaphorina citri]